VFNPRGEKIADCGNQKDAVNLLNMRNNRWDGHYYMFNPLPGDIINVSSGKQLPTRDIVVNMDGGVGGSWKEVSDEEFDELFDFSKQKQLPENQQQPLDL
tara:strand:- start:1551 stop:1850 length:300 start_codon:yes stop_codon:yes gene_type:complete